MLNIKVDCVTNWKKIKQLYFKWGVSFIKDNVSRRIEKYLQSKPTDNEISDYLKTLRDNMKILEDKFSRNMIIIFALMTIFYFLTNSQVTKINVGPIEVKDVSNVYIFIPLIMAYKYYEINSIMLIRRFTRIIHLEFLKKTSPSLLENKLEYFLLPVSIFLSNEVIFEGSKNWLVIQLIIILDQVIILSFLSFELYSLYYSYNNYPHNIWFWIIMSCSILITILGFLTINNKRSKEIRKYRIKK